MSSSPAAALAALFHGAHFVKSAAKLSQCPEDTGAEVAFAGRSNAGKSSALNALTNQGKLARTSKTPGRTQLINFFAMPGDARLVDLPGYGYAKVPEEVKHQWQAELDRYLQKRQSLAGLVLLMDIRHPLQAYDRHMLAWASQAELPVHILLTKADKLNRGPAMNVLQQVRRELKTLSLPSLSLQLFSAPKGDGVDEARRVIGTWLGLVDTPAEDAGEE